MRRILVAVIAALIVAGPVVLASSCIGCCFTGTAHGNAASACCGDERPAPAAPESDCRCEHGDPIAASTAKAIAMPAPPIDVGAWLAPAPTRTWSLEAAAPARALVAPRAAGARARAAPLSLRC